MSIETMKQALDWMEWFAGDDHSIRPKSKALDIAQALRQAIDVATNDTSQERVDEIQEHRHEPVAMVMPVATVISETGDETVTMSWWHEPALPVGTQLYTSPPQRQPLTDEEIRKAKHHMVEGAYHYSFQQGVRYAEAAHDIKGEA
jgi:hypothetical protein